MGPKERAALWSWLGFTGTFATVRAITYSIRNGKGPFRNLSVSGEHLHHYMWGIGMLALIVDEFALLLDLEDVYWAKQGRISVDLGVGLVAAGGTSISAVPIIRRLVHRGARPQSSKLRAPASFDHW